MTAATPTSRPIPWISLANFNNRIDEIMAQVIHAAETDGLFSPADTEISKADIDSIFATSESSFALSDEIKFEVFFTTRNFGWEKRGQVRPSLSPEVLVDPSHFQAEGVY